MGHEERALIVRPEGIEHVQLPQQRLGDLLRLELGVDLEGGQEARLLARRMGIGLDALGEELETVGVNGHPRGEGMPAEVLQTVLTGLYRGIEVEASRATRRARKPVARAR